jgi:hypothetical protein
VKKLIAASAVCLVAGVAGPAYAHTAAQGAHKVKVDASVSPSSGVKTGGKLVLTGKHGLKSTSYNCLLVIVHHSTAGQGTANLTSIVQVNSNSKGTFKCTETFKPFSGIDAGKTVNCPTTKAQAKKGYSCAVAYYDSATTGKKSDGFAKFTAK